MIIQKFYCLSSFHYFSNLLILLKRFGVTWHIVAEKAIDWTRIFTPVKVEVKV